MQLRAIRLGYPRSAQQRQMCCAGGIMLSSYEDGAAAYERGDYATARQLWLPLAEGGNADAQTIGSSHQPTQAPCRL
jgi:hypothetical protein